MADEAQDEACLSPIGSEFWIGQVMTIFGVVIGIWLSARAGFTEAARFSQHQDYRLARNTLRVLKKEFSGNVAQLRTAKESLEQNRPVRIELRTLHLKTSVGKSYMASVNPRIVVELQRLYGQPLEELVARTKEDGAAVEKRDLQILTRLIDRADKVILPLFEAQEKAFDAAEAKLTEGR